MKYILGILASLCSIGMFIFGYSYGVTIVEVILLWGYVMADNWGARHWRK